jgi:hypothetical protein
MPRNTDLILTFGAVILCFSLCLTGGNAAQAFTLNTTVTGTGIGTVTSSPAGIHCGTLCSADFNAGRKVTLTAKADSKSYFTGWSGGGCTGAGSCTVTMNSAVSVAANFDVQIPSISILPDSLDFGDVEIGATTYYTLRIGNTGTGPLKVNVSVQEDTEFKVNKKTFTVSPQKSQNIKFTFKPTDVGVKKALESGSLWLSPTVGTPEDGSIASWPRDENGDDSEATASGASRQVNAQASIASNDTSNPDLIVPLTALVQYPTKTYSLVIKYRLKFNNSFENWTYNEDASIPMTVTKHQKSGYPPQWVIDCNNTNVSSGWKCNGDSTWTYSGTMATHDSDCPQCTWSGSGSSNYDLTGPLQSDQILLLTLNPTNSLGTVATDCGNCGSGTTPLPSILSGKRTPDIPFRPGSCVTKKINVEGLTGTMEWCLQ